MVSHSLHLAQRGGSLPVRRIDRTTSTQRAPHRSLHSVEGYHRIQWDVRVHCILHRQTMLRPLGVDSLCERTSPGHILIGHQSDGPRAPSLPELASDERFIAVADAHRPTMSWLRGTYSRNFSFSCLMDHYMGSSSAVGTHTKSVLR
nr:uncharacterized protein LOC129381020 [Dermacentor andersoni]